MCELLAMDCNTPTDINFSFAGFSQRGGRTGPHTDGWGVGFYEDRAARVFLEPAPCADSPLAAFLRAHSIKTLQAVAHIRRKTRGTVKLANTHPFVRELWGRAWVFAHNGTVRHLPPVGGGRFQPIGDTDSEMAFCALLNAVCARVGDVPPTDPQTLWRAIADVAGEIAEGGTFNFVMADGEHLYARCDTRLCYIVRKAPFGRATLKDDDLSVDFSALTTARDRVAVIATAPLTVDEAWTHGAPATMWVFTGGDVVATLPSGRPIARGAEFCDGEQAR